MLFKVNECQYTMETSEKILSTAWEILQRDELHNSDGAFLIPRFDSYEMTTTASHPPVYGKIPMVYDYLYISCSGKIYRMTVVMVPWKSHPSCNASVSIRELDPEGSIVAVSTIPIDENTPITHDVLSYTVSSDNMNPHKITERLSANKGIIHTINSTFFQTRNGRNNFDLLPSLNDIDTRGMKATEYVDRCKHVYGALSVYESFVQRPAILMDRPYV